MEKVVQVPGTTPLSKLSQVREILKKVPTGTDKRRFYLTVLVGVLVVFGGIITGFLLAGGGGRASVAPGAKSTAREMGITDQATFRDSARGKLEAGGVAGEGTHHLVRDGGPSQYVYLTSTVIDLESFIGKEVEVWGQTISGRKAGWLMDVGKIKVVD